MSSQDKKRADNVGSSRSRLANDKDKTKLKAGERHQQEFTKFIKALLKGIETVSYTHLTLPTNREV